MLPVEQPFKTYTDLDGKPLDNGYVHFGEPNQNPITKPITVFWDPEGTQPALQPLRTINGYIMRAGTPANVFYDGAYSELVLDRKKRQVFYSRTSDEFSLAAVVLNLAKSVGSSLMGFLQAGVGAVLRTVQDKLRERVSVKDFGAMGDGGINDTAAFTRARAVSSGAYHIPDGVYVLDAAPDVFADRFTAGGNVTLIISGTEYDVSNAFAGRLRYLVASNVLTWIVDAKTGNYVMGLQNGAGGTATYFQRGLSIQTDSHWVQVGPKTYNGSVDKLYQRSATHPTDPAGNRFNETFEEAPDRLIWSFATSASGAPGFDSAMILYAGPEPRLDFPGLRPRFSQGWKVTTRADGNFSLVMTPTAHATYLEKESGPRFITFQDTGAMGFFGSGGTAKPTITGSRGGNAALASMLAAGDALGLWANGTTA